MLAAFGCMGDIPLRMARYHATLRNDRSLSHAYRSIEGSLIVRWGALVLGVGYVCHAANQFNTVEIPRLYQE